jgi:hypothetical protein
MFRRGIRAISPVVINGVTLTVTATELNEIGGQGAVAADFAKLAALTGDSTELNRVDDTLYGTPGNSLVRVAKAQYDFAVHGGVAGSISLAVPIPDNAIVLDGVLEVITPLTSDGAATAAVQVNGADDIIAATVIAGAPWHQAGLKDIVPVGTAVTAVKTTAARNVTLVVGVADLKAGKFNVWLRWVQGD